MLKIRIKKLKKTHLLNLFLVGSLLIIAVVLKINHIELIALTLTLFIILKKARFSYFSIFSFILWFSFLQEYFASINTMFSSGRLKWDTSIAIYHSELFLCEIIFYIIELIFFFTTDVLENEKILYKCDLNISKKMAYIFVTCGFILIVLAYPSLPTFNTELERDMGIVPSSLVVPLSMLLLGVTYDWLKKGWYFRIITFISLFWVMFHGDRVIVLGYVVYFILKYINNANEDFKTLKSIIFSKRVFFILIVIFVAVIISIRVQYTRSGNVYDLNFETLLLNLLKQGTAADVVHVFNCATDMWQNGQGLNGYSYLYYLDNILPSANPNLYSAVILQKNYNTMGGGLFFAEPMMNGGMLLCIVQSLVYIAILVWAFNKKNSYHAYVIIPFSILIFRFAWYATCAGLVKMLIYYVPFVYFVSKKIK